MTARHLQWSISVAAAVFVTASLHSFAATGSAAWSAGTEEGQAQAQPGSAGADLFRTYCIVCHGQTGVGDGPLASSLRRKPANLTEIAKRNGGEYPSQLIFRVIDGRQPVRGHGGPDMPTWGDAFSRTIEGGDEQSVRERIDALVKYLESIQVAVP